MISRRLSRKLVFLVLLVLLAMVTGLFLPDLFVLHPRRQVFGSPGAGRRALPFRGGELEVWTARSRPQSPPGRRPDVYVLRFYGNSHVIGPNVGEAAGWPELDVEFWGVNYPGFGGSTGPAHLRAMGPAALAAYDALRAEAGAGRPILVFGTSFGTVAALCVAARHPEVAGVVLQNPPPLRQIILRAWGWWNLWLVAGPAALAVPGDLDSVANARAAHMKAVFLLSDQDEVIAPKYARLVADAYAGEKRVIPLPGARHNSPLDAGETRDLHGDVAWMLETKGIR